MDRAAAYQKLEALLAGHRVQLIHVLELAKPTHGRDRIAQKILDGYAANARSYLRRLEATLRRPVLLPTHGDLGLWGENGLAPTIRSLVRSAEFHAGAGIFELEAKPIGNGRYVVAA